MPFWAQSDAPDSSGPSRMFRIAQLSLVLFFFFLPHNTCSTSLSFCPHRSGRKTGSLTASATSSITTSRAACPLSLPGVSFVSSDRWRGNPELAQCPSPHTLCQVRRTWTPLLLAYGNGGNCLWAHHLQKSPREFSFKFEFHKYVHNTQICILEVYIPTYPVQMAPIFIFFKTKRDERLVLYAVCF